MPVYSLPNPTPIVSLVGVFRPRLFVSTQVLGALSPEELDLSMAHELAHLSARDNLKRVLAACSPDALSIVGFGRRLEQRWRAAIEFAADARAVAGDEQRAVSLVSALVTVARLSPPAQPSFLMAGSDFYDGELLKARIDRLLDPALGRRQSTALVPVWPISLVAFLVLAALLPSQAVWVIVHVATEGLVRVLP